VCLACSRDQAHLARRTRWSGGFLACALLADVGLLQDMRGSPFLRVIELPSSTQNGQSPWAEWVHATYVRRFRRAGSAGEFGEDGACCSRGPIACAVRFRACGRGIGAASGLDGRCDHPAQGAMCRLSWSARSAAFTGLRMVSAASSSKEFRHLSSTMGGDAAGLACSCCLPAQA